MRGILIIKDDLRIHTGDDLDLVQEVKELDNPTPQTYTVEVPGRNGLLNLTDALTGNVCYKNRTLKFQYLANGDNNTLMSIISLFNSFHGQAIRIIDDDTPDWYYEGIATVKVKRDSVLAKITLELNADPFRQRLELTNRGIELSTVTKELVINNDGVVVIPTVIVSDSTKIVVGTNTYNLSSGSYLLANLELKTGANVLKVSGSGTLTVQYREARI